MKNIEKIQFGPYEMDTWYYSPFPDDFENLDILYMCEICLRYFTKEEEYKSHCKKCAIGYPPGVEIYRDESISVFEIDGAQELYYCQNLCLLSKLFLDKKTVYYDIDPFLFYVLCEINNKTGCHFVYNILLYKQKGYFSKEKNSINNNNLSCILILPPYHSQSYGRFLISIAYELSKREHKVGSPEKPISDLGILTFRSYWKYKIKEVLLDYKERNEPLNIKRISEITCITTDDIIDTMVDIGILYQARARYTINMKKLDSFLEAHISIPKILCKSENLKWEKSHLNLEKINSLNL